MNTKSNKFLEDLFKETELTLKIKNRIQDAVLNAKEYPLKMEDFNKMLNEEFSKEKLTKAQEIRIVELLENLL